MKRTIAFFVVLSLVCCSAFALPGWGDIFGKRSAKESLEIPQEDLEQELQQPAEELSETSPETEQVTEPTPVLSEELPNPIYESLGKLQASIDALDGRMTTKDTANVQADLISKIEAVSKSMEDLIADNEKKDEQIDTLLNEVQRVKYFANVGVVAGFKDLSTPAFGAVVNFGCKFRTGVTLSLGGQYFLMEGLEFKPEFRLDKAQATFTVGYEW